MPFLRSLLFLVLFFIFSVIAGHGNEIPVEEEGLLPAEGSSLMKSSSLPGRGLLAMPDLGMGWLMEEWVAPPEVCPFHSKWPLSTPPESSDDGIWEIERGKWRKKDSR